MNFIASCLDQLNCPSVCNALCGLAIDLHYLISNLTNNNKRKKKSININFSTARGRMSHFARGTVLCEKLKALIRNYCTSIKWRKKTYMYPAIFKSGSLLGQSKNEQPHVILFPSSQAEAEAPLAAFQLHHKAALLFTRKIVSF